MEGAFNVLRRLGRRLCRALCLPAEGGDDEGELEYGLLEEEAVSLWYEGVAEGPAGMAMDEDMVRGREGS